MFLRVLNCKWRLVIVGMVVCVVLGACNEAVQSASLTESRKKAAHRKRRIIFNNDGDDAWMAEEATVEAYLATRMKPAMDTQVDTVFLCTTEDIGNYLHRSKICELFTRDHPQIPISKEVRLVENLAKQDTDILEGSIDLLHKHGKEIFWSHRMNGMEDMGGGWFLRGSFKHDHPQWWIGPADNEKKYPTGDYRRYYLVMDYGVKEVRDYLLAIFQEVIENYDIDGIELDYMRNTWLFKELFEDPPRPVTEEHSKIMVDFHKKIRALLDEKSRRTGKVLLLAIRVPKWPEISKYFGLDIEANLKSGAIDILTGSGGYTPFSLSPKEFIELGHKYGVPVQVCISASSMRSRVPGSKRGDLIAWRGAAMNLWDAGVDGQYLFNTFPAGPKPNLAVRVMEEIGDPEVIVGKEMLFALDTWKALETAGFANLAIKREQLLPAGLDSDGRSRGVQLYIGYDIAAEAKAGRLRGAELKIWFSELTEGDKVEVSLNGAVVKAAKTDIKTGVVTYYPSDSVYRRGKNYFEFTVLEKAGGRGKAIAVENIELRINYEQ